MSEALIDVMRKAFVESTMLAFRKMIMVDLNECYGGEIKDHPWELSGVIGFSGDIVGNCALRMSLATVQEAITRLAGERVDDSAELSDGVGEFVNMITGNAKAALKGYSLSLSFPDVIRGKGHEISFHRHSETFSLFFTSEIGPITVIVAFGEPRHD